MTRRDMSAALLAGFIGYLTAYWYFTISLFVTIRKNSVVDMDVYAGFAGSRLTIGVGIICLLLTLLYRRMRADKADPSGEESNKAQIWPAHRIVATGVILLYLVPFLAYAEMERASRGSNRLSDNTEMMVLIYLLIPGFAAAVATIVLFLSVIVSGIRMVLRSRTSPGN